MKFEIKNRFTGAVQFECELSAEVETASDSIKMGFAIKEALKARAYLARADLAGAYLADANLAGADLAGANLAGADLAGANNVPETNGSECVQSGKRPPRKTPAERAADYRARNPDVPVVEALDAKILAAIDAGGKLRMDQWHTCETTHCRAGWAITLAGDAGADLERKYGPQRAGSMIYRASTGRVPRFFASNKNALADIKACASKPD